MTRTPVQIAFINGYRLVAQASSIVLPDHTHPEWDAVLETHRALWDTGDRYRHRARGTTYTVLSEDAELQKDMYSLADGTRMVVYIGEDGRLWLRNRYEFHDGRFERLPAEDTSV